MFEHRVDQGRCVTDRGHHLVGAGRSIAVQNFNENTSVLVMIALYSMLLHVGHSIYAVILVYGGFVALRPTGRRAAKRCACPAGPVTWCRSWPG